MGKSLVIGVLVLLMLSLAMHAGLAVSDIASSENVQSGSVPSSNVLSSNVICEGNCVVATPTEDAPHIEVISQEEMPSSEKSEAQELEAPSGSPDASLSEGMTESQSGTEESSASVKPKCELCIKAKGAIVYAATRDYLSVIKNLVQKILDASLALKIFLIALILLILLIIWNFTLRDNRTNNLRRARKHHLKGEMAHMRGDEEAAKRHYEKANRLRQKAEEQW